MDILVADVMTRSPVTVGPDESLYDCAKKMVRKGVGALILVKDKKISGFVSQKDILWAVVKKPNIDLKKVLAKNVSPKKVITIRSTDTLERAIKVMKKKKFDRLPVLAKDKTIAGIITIKDILSFNPDIYPELGEFAKIREEQEKLKRVKEAEKRIVHEGICEECGRPDVVFYRMNGLLVCESCRNSM